MPEESPIPEAFVRRNRSMRNLILDYSLGNAIVGLNPFPGTLWLTLLIAIVLLFKMSRDIRKQWNYPKRYDLLAIAGQLFGIAGAFAIALLTWLGVFLLGFIFPAIRALCLSTALFTLTWTWGQSIHHFHSSGHPRTQTLNP